jgi:hypothetical protein
MRRSGTPSLWTSRPRAALDRGRFSSYSVGREKSFLFVVSPASKEDHSPRCSCCRRRQGPREAVRPSAG